MSDNLKFVKLVSQETVIGVQDGEVLKEIVAVQAIPMNNGGMQIALLPYGFPYEDEVRGEIKMQHVLFEYKDVPEDLKNKYIETKSNIRIASGFGNMGGNDMGGLII